MNKITLAPHNPIAHQGMIDWLETHVGTRDLKYSGLGVVGDGWWIEVYINKIVVTIADPELALLFKLMWS